MNRLQIVQGSLAYNLWLLGHHLRKGPLQGSLKHSRKDNLLKASLIQHHLILGKRIQDRLTPANLSTTTHPSKSRHHNTNRWALCNLSLEADRPALSRHHNLKVRFGVLSLQCRKECANLLLDQPI